MEALFDDEGYDCSTNYSGSHIYVPGTLLALDYIGK